jgi:hypothetical protein
MFSDIALDELQIANRYWIAGASAAHNATWQKS